MKLGYLYTSIYLNQCWCSNITPAAISAQRTLLIFLMVFSLLLAPLANAADKVVVNRVRLSAEQLSHLEQQLNTHIVPGRYWYDKRSGLWGNEGEGNKGQLPANLSIAAPMPADISGTGTGVWVNGREIHWQEYQSLMRVYGRVIPGRYFLEANGNSGFEGGPVAYNLFADARPKQKQHINWFHGGHEQNGGSVIGGGGTVGFIGSGGSSVICEGGSCTFN